MFHKKGMEMPLSTRNVVGVTSIVYVRKAPNLLKCFMV